MEFLNEIAVRPWMSIYLKIIAVILAFGAISHIRNMLGYGEKPFAQFPTAWKIGDVYFTILNVVAVIGLWKKAGWGILAFLIAMFSQFIIYTIFIKYFAFTDEHRKAIRGLLITEAIMVGIFVILILMKR